MAADPRTAQDPVPAQDSVLAVLRDVEAACAALPAEELRRYRECQESIVQARAQAPAVEGQLWVC